MNNELSLPYLLSRTLRPRGVSSNGLGQVRSGQLRKDDDGFEYLRNWLIFVVTVASWIFYVSNGRKINSLSGNILTKIIIQGYSK
jgi:hypothetical protein